MMILRLLPAVLRSPKHLDHDELTFQFTTAIDSRLQGDIDRLLRRGEAHCDTVIIKSIETDDAWLQGDAYRSLDACNVS